MESLATVEGNVDASRFPGGSPATATADAPSGVWGRRGQAVAVLADRPRAGALALALARGMAGYWKERGLRVAAHPGLSRVHQACYGSGRRCGVSGPKPHPGIEQWLQRAAMHAHFSLACLAPLSGWRPKRLVRLARVDRVVLVSRAGAPPCPAHPDWLPPARLLHAIDPGGARGSRSEGCWAIYAGYTQAAALLFEGPFADAVAYVACCLMVPPA